MVLPNDAHEWQYDYPKITTNKFVLGQKNKGLSHVRTGQ